MHEFIFKQFDNELMEYILNEAKQVGNHISAHQGVTVKVEVLQIAMDRILKDFNINKIKLFDKPLQHHRFLPYGYRFLFAKCRTIARSYV